MKSILIKPYQHSRSVSLFLCGTLVEALPFYSSSLNVLLRVIRGNSGCTLEIKANKNLAGFCAESILFYQYHPLNIWHCMHLLRYFSNHTQPFLKFISCCVKKKRWEAARLSKLALVKKEKGKIVMPAFFTHTTKKSTCPHQYLFIYLFI